MRILSHKAGNIAGLTCGFVLLHAWLVRRHGVDAMALSYVMQLAAPLLAAAVAAWKGRDARDEHASRWRLVALAFVLWAAGMGGSMCIDLFQQACRAADNAGTIAYVLYGVPLLLVLATPPAEWASPVIRLIDAAMVVILTALIIVNTLLLSSAGDAGVDTQTRVFVAMFDAENILLMLFALIRRLTSSNPEGNALYGTLAVYTMLYCLVATYYNHHVVESLQLDAGSAYDLLVELPFAAFVLAALAGVPGGTKRSLRSPSVLRFASAVPPFFLTITVVVLAALTAHRTFYFGMACTMLAILGYGIRSTLLQAHHIGATHLAEQDRDALATLAWRDALTGLANRRAFDAAMDAEWQRALRSGKNLGLLMIDIDEFKAINDRNGHVAGDQVIRDVGQALASVASLSRDVLARYGGEEFACLMPATTLEQARSVAERMRAAVEALGLRHPSNDGVVTVSVGAASLLVQPHDDVRTLVAAADGALYEAKRSGRNKVRG